MINIKFYQKAYIIKQLLKKGKISKEGIFYSFEEFRQSEPVVFNIETTNNCNMKCKMCPRTTQMTRKVETMSLETFKKIIDQIRPWNPLEWDEWTNFIKKTYKVKENEMNENHFFLYIIPQVINLHGYGEPLLDDTIVDKVNYMTLQNIKSYFSCNPFNITFKKGTQLIDAGLTYFKFSGDNIKLFEKNEEIIKDLISYNDSEGMGFNTTFILDIVDNQKDYEKLQKMFKDYDVYMYQKSKDNQWYDPAKKAQLSIHWLETCQFPWSSMSIMSDGSVVPCTQDYNNEMVLGNVKYESLIDIWNGVPYYHLRKNHLINLNKIKCKGRCDMKLIGD